MSHFPSAILDSTLVGRKTLTLRMRNTRTSFVVQNNTLFIDGTPHPLTEGQLYERVYRMMISELFVDVRVDGSTYTPVAGSKLLAKTRAK